MENKRYLVNYEKKIDYDKEIDEFIGKYNEKKRKEEAKKTGTKGTHILSGRALFKYDPTFFFFI